ncbi:MULTISPECIES: DUF6973 domain-containing protein [Weeksella]|uniref:DUF6973 domain-containing protein n=1 Tax=Weeksella virosa (strain ATCC 43766 / DSM 16922 / JCM 21250 / CCUG 30538 / CDC 9751 / IAM 14551 / NBRC 16016 / NCTC 11634 / CL345/78) TaxID=865938 RepID=F0P0X1_WEEVC|nr:MULTISPECIES: hypothetical protein [Weeksella]ADX68555.1 hypothetical protein Weevi_1867 [Weeksella virosa DSM 16922]MDK7375231.1 hypothetical protein [Weeksella virosa]MDK7675275.1 hypothetical protein [Weeksella virosa]
MKSILFILKNLSFNLCREMVKTMLSNPLLLLPTVWGTVESVAFSELNYAENHSGRGVSNAFRHAAWNVLIAYNCSYFISHEKALAWAKKITDLHEECFRNEDFDRLMDLHNNQIGRMIYKENISKPRIRKNLLIQKIVEKSETAQGLSDSHKIREYSTEMVFYKEN